MDCRQCEGELISRTCPRCDAPGRAVQLITLRSLLTARALERLTRKDYRFCPTPNCDIVYFSHETLFERQDVRVPVFQKEPAGRRIVCYCFELIDGDANPDAESRIREHVQAGRCACELRNPEGTCCLANLRTLIRVDAAAVQRNDFPAKNVIP